MKKVTRRTFLSSGVKALGAGIAASVVGSISPGVLGASGSPDREWRKLWQEQEWAFVVDTRRCIGCAKCVTACNKENGVPEGREVYRTWVERYVSKPSGRVHIDSPQGGLDFSELGQEEEKGFFVPKLCNQCENPPCVRVCPVAATYKTGDGVVLVDRQRCIGCRYCIQACPYGARFLHPTLHVADKCTWCYHRVVKGLLPACVQVCPTGARIFGNLRDPDNPVSPILKKNRVGVLKPDMGTEPRVYYLGLDKVVR